MARAARRPALVWLGAGVHANEPSGTTAALAVLSRLASGDDCETRRILHGTVAVVVPDQNPDGRARRTRTNAADVDLNRDWFAASQPETRARLAVLRRYPPTVAVDAHEQTGTGYFSPPYARPVVAGLPTPTRRIADGPVRRAVDRAMAAAGVRTTHRAGYDLLYPGYADAATSLLFGAGGMTYEQGSDLPLAEKTRRHAVAMRATLAAVAGDGPTVVRAWARGFA
ncbi:M14 family zinc carboxypeptidase, partial [Patulibacter sp. S7RM1-6]